MLSGYHGMNSEWWYVPKYLLEEKKGPFFEHAIEGLAKRNYASVAMYPTRE